MEYSVSIYKDKNDCILVIPQGFDEFGIRRDINSPKTIKKPYNNEELGEIVIQAFSVAKNAPLHNSKSLIKVYEIATGIKSWAKFSKDRTLVVGTFNPDEGYKFSAWERGSDASYTPSTENNKTLEIGLNARNIEIGETVNNCFS